MLTAATLGMFAYGVYSVGSAVMDLIGPLTLEIWVNLGVILFGALLILAAAFVRVLIPGGLALAIGAMLGLQAIAIHNHAHSYGQMIPGLQIARGIFAAALVVLAFLGSRRELARRR